MRREYSQAAQAVREMMSARRVGANLSSPIKSLWLVLLNNSRNLRIIEVG
jgi:hypothetical protein